MAKLRDFFERQLALEGPKNRWEEIGDLIFRREGIFVWREDGKWWRVEFPPLLFRVALMAGRLAPGGLFARQSGPYATRAEAQVGRAIRMRRKGAEDGR